MVSNSKYKHPDHLPIPLKPVLLSKTSYRLRLRTCRCRKNAQYSMKNQQTLFLYLIISFFFMQYGHGWAAVSNGTKPIDHFDHFSNMPTKEIDTSFYKDNIVQLESVFGQNKTIISKYQLQILIALSYFPELKDVRIKFVYKKIKTTMQCKPTFKTLLKNTNREYVININKNESFSGVLIDDAPFNAQIGLIAHEIAHIIDYESGNRKHVMSRGFDYLKESSKKKYESTVDSITVAYGLGWQLYDWAYFSLNNSKSSQKYKDFKSRIYMSPDLILEQIKREERYSDHVSNEDRSLHATK